MAAGHLLQSSVSLCYVFLQVAPWEQASSSTAPWSEIHRGAQSTEKRNKKTQGTKPILKNPKPHTKAKGFKYALRSVQAPTDEPWWICLLWCIVLLIPTFDFLTSPSPQQGWQRSTCPHLSCSSTGPGTLSQSLCSWNWDATLWTETKLFT